MSDLIVPRSSAPSPESKLKPLPQLRIERHPAAREAALTDGEDIVISITAGDMDTVDRCAGLIVAANLRAIPADDPVAADVQAALGGHIAKLEGAIATLRAVGRAGGVVVPMRRDGRAPRASRR